MWSHSHILSNSLSARFFQCSEHFGETPLIQKPKQEARFTIVKRLQGALDGSLYRLQPPNLHRLQPRDLYRLHCHHGSGSESRVVIMFQVIIAMAIMTIIRTIIMITTVFYHHHNHHHIHVFFFCIISIIEINNRNIQHIIPSSCSSPSSSEWSKETLKGSSPEVVSFTRTGVMVQVSRICWL